MTLVAPANGNKRGAANPCRVSFSGVLLSVSDFRCSGPPVYPARETRRARNPDGQGFPGSRNFRDFPAAHNNFIIESAGLHWGVLAAFIAVIFAYVLLSRHLMGFQIKLAGQSPRAARFAGVNPTRLVIFCLGGSGALAGLAGMFEVTGPAGQISIDFNSGYGFTAIIVAFLGRLNPIGILLAGLLMALTYIGGEAAQSTLGLPGAAIQLLQGMLLFFLLAVDVLTNFKIRRGNFSLWLEKMQISFDIEYWPK